MGDAFGRHGPKFSFEVRIFPLKTVRALVYSNQWQPKPVGFGGMSRFAGRQPGRLVTADVGVSGRLNCV
jgi:hypothetical protein